MPAKVRWQADQNMWNALTIEKINFEVIFKTDKLEIICGINEIKLKC